MRPPPLLRGLSGALRTLDVREDRRRNGAPVPAIREPQDPEGTRAQVGRIDPPDEPLLLFADCLSGRP